MTILRGPILSNVDATISKEFGMVPSSDWNKLGITAYLGKLGSFRHKCIGSFGRKVK